MPELQPGAPAPAFTLANQAVEPVSLSDYAGRKVLLFFYPKADTGGWTAQAIAMRDIADRVGTTAIVGISPDKPAKQAKFDTKHALGFPLLSDEDHAVAGAYDVWREKSMYGKKYMGILRSAFLVDEEGRIEHAWYNVKPADTATNLLNSL